MRQHHYHGTDSSATSKKDRPLVLSLAALQINRKSDHRISRGFSSYATTGTANNANTATSTPTLNHTPNQAEAAASMAGCESTGGNTLLTDFILFAQKLEHLGFTYHEGRVTIVESVEESKLV